MTAPRVELKIDLARVRPLDKEFTFFSEPGAKQTAIYVVSQCDVFTGSGYMVEEVVDVFLPPAAFNLVPHE